MAGDEPAAPRRREANRTLPSDERKQAHYGTPGSQLSMGAGTTDSVAAPSTGTIARDV